MLVNGISDSVKSMSFDNLWRVVGQTPLYVINFHFKGEQRTIYAKFESSNFSGSIKDRMALYILQRAYERGEIHPGDTIVEATSGNTGIAFSAIGRALGHKICIVMPDWMSRERVDIIKSFGADIISVSKEEGGFLGSIRITEQIKASKNNIFLPCQFSNQDNAAAHFMTTGPELWRQMRDISITPDAFVAGVGTGGTIMGVGQFLRSQNPAAKVYPMEPAESPTMTTGYKVGSHRIQGISDEFIPVILNLEELDDVIQVSDGDSILMAQKLSQQLGLGVGISSGANFIAAIVVQELLGGKDVNVATVFADCNKKYLSTDLMREEPVRDDYCSPFVEFLGFSVVR